jgi:hypothetical protein
MRRAIAPRAQENDILETVKALTDRGGALVFSDRRHRLVDLLLAA